jgi:hypothetical protein
MPRSDQEAIGPWHPVDVHEELGERVDQFEPHTIGTLAEEPSDCYWPQAGTLNTWLGDHREKTRMVSGTWKSYHYRMTVAWQVYRGRMSQDAQAARGPHAHAQMTWDRPVNRHSTAE